MVVSQDPKKSPYRLVIAGLLILANLGFGLNLFAPSPILPLLIEDYGISQATAGLFVALPLLIASMFGLPGGVILARLGVKRSLTAGYWLLGLVALTALAPNFVTLLIMRLAYGLGIAFIFIATGPVLMRWFQPKGVFIINGLSQASFSLGIATSVSTAVPLAAAVGWSNTLSIFGIIGVVGAIAWTILGRPVGQASPPVPLLSGRELWAIFSNRTVLLLVVGDTGALLQYTALTTWLPSFYNEVHGISMAHAGFITGLMTFVGIFAVLLGGFGPARIGSRKVFLIVPGVLVVIGGSGAFLFGSLPGIYTSVVLLGVGSWLYVPSIFSMPMEIPEMTPEKVAIVWGFIMTFAGLGAFLSPLLVGVLRDLSGSFMPGFIICAMAAWSLLAAGIFMPKLAPANE